MRSGDAVRLALEEADEQGVDMEWQEPVSDEEYSAR